MVIAVAFLTQRRRDTETSLRSLRLCVKNHLHDCISAPLNARLLFDLFKITRVISYRTKIVSEPKEFVCAEQRATVKDCPYEGNLYQIIRVNDFKAGDVVEI